MNVTASIGAEVCFPQANFLTIDVEDWYRLVHTYFDGHRESDGIAFERQLNICLDLLSKYDCKATFFCLGSSLFDRSHLIKRISADGHEIASHGWEHKRIREIGLPTFKEDLRRSIGWLEATTARKVHGYRAPLFGVAPEQIDGFLDICMDAGLRYDSSIFPVSGWRYGAPGQSRHPRIIRSRGSEHLIEFPIATYRFFGKVWPAGGGGWWRVMPGSLIRHVFDSVEVGGDAFMTYFHPYEFDDQPLIASHVTNVTAKIAWWVFTQNLGRQSLPGKVEKILANKRFVTVSAYLENLRLL